MLLEKHPELQRLDNATRVQLAVELWDSVREDVVELPPVLLEAILERVAYNDAHPEQVFTTEEVTARLAALKKRIAERRKAHA